jgi:hypothetical protein
MLHASQHSKKLPGAISNGAQQWPEGCQPWMAWHKEIGAAVTVQNMTSRQIVIHKCFKAVIIARRPTDACLLR